MGIVIRQSFKNTISTYLGFGIGAINTLFLYTYFLTDVHYGLVSYLISVAVIMTPFLTFGVHNTIIKFFSGYVAAGERQRFTAMMFFLPLLISIPAGIIGFLGYEWIAIWLSQKNEILEDYLWITFGIAFCMAYFEVFYAWARVNMRSVTGNFLKEVFHRIGIMILLFMVYFEWFGIRGFIYGIAIMYFLRMLLMLAVAIAVKKPKMVFKLPENTKEVMKYSGFILLAGAVSVVFLDIDKFMIGQFKAIENVAFYNVAIFIATVISVPSRAMQQIINPITATLLNTNDTKTLSDIYKRSSLNLYIIGGFIFLLIILNIDQLYMLIPEQYSNGLWVVFLIALAKLFDNLLGNNNAILFNSKYYRTVLVFGLLLAVLTICLNLVFIPVWGINGAAFATFLAFSLYNTAKIGFVYAKFRMHPFSGATLKVTVVLAILIPLFWFWDFSFHPVMNIALKSVLLGLLYGLAVIALKLSDDLSGLLSKYIKR